MPGEALAPGRIYNSNRFTLRGLGELFGCELHDYGIVPDNLEATREVLRRAAAECDVIVTSGGVSVGDADYVKPAVEAEGKLLMWRIAMKPGRPLAFGSVQKSFFIGLPGNPVSSFVTFLIFVRPFLLRTQGLTAIHPKSIAARADFEWLEPDARREFLRVKWNAQGGLDLYPDAGLGGAHLDLLGARAGGQSRRAGDSQGRPGAFPALLGAVLVKVKVLLFANLREKVGTGVEVVDLPDSASTVAGLRLHLMKRGGAWNEALADMKVVRVAVNQDMAAANAPLNPGDEIAFFPPVTRRMKISVQQEDFDLGLEVLDIQQDNRIGAVASFVGQVRDVPMTLEHYPGMTENAIKKIVEEARSQWQIMDYTVIHRYGDLQPNDQIVLVAIASSHRGDAFAACQFIMDYLKTQAPFWKKEHHPEGARWVNALESDDQAAARWRGLKQQRLLNPE